MITDNSIEIDASGRSVWDVFVDVEHWPEWTASVQRIVRLDGPGIEVGNRFQIKQPRLPNLTWEVTAVEPGVSWTWCQRSPGATTLATHRARPARNRTDTRTAAHHSAGAGRGRGRCINAEPHQALSRPRSARPQSAQREIAPHPPGTCCPPVMNAGPHRTAGRPHRSQTERAGRDRFLSPAPTERH